MGATERRFSAIDGTPLHYWRWNDGTAGQRSEQRAFVGTNELHDRLVGWLREVRALSARHASLGPVTRIVSAGAYVNKPGQHGLGRAFDLDQVLWSNGACTPYHHEHGSGDIAIVRRYLAVDALARRHFRFVLDGGYNRAHADHLHLDLGGVPIRCDRASRSDTAFVQMVANAHLGSGLAVDGAWGPRTQTAFDESLRRLGVAGDPHAPGRPWLDWLHHTARHGFANRAFGQPTPVRQPSLLDPLTDLLDGLLKP
ncbi:hypothetical protein BH20ACT2_BH20ACT2_22770 [soil metagenome]